VHVARSVLGRLEDERVDEADERRVGDAVVLLEVVLFLALDLRDPQLVPATFQLLESRIKALEELYARG